MIVIGGYLWSKWRSRCLLLNPYFRVLWVFLVIRNVTPPIKLFKLNVFIVINPFNPGGGIVLGDSIEEHIIVYLCGILDCTLFLILIDDFVLPNEERCAIVLLSILKGYINPRDMWI